jgi:hypothetical protein
MVDKVENTTEGELLEMSKHFKELMEKKEKEMEKIKEENMNLKKILISVYGVLRIIDELIDFSFEIPTDIATLIETIRGYLSDYMDKYIFLDNA